MKLVKQKTEKRQREKWDGSHKNASYHRKHKSARCVNSTHLPRSDNTTKPKIRDLF